MKTMIILTLSAVVVALLSFPLQAQSKKYGIKSGVVTFEETTTMGKMKIEGKQVIYFDEYGLKECRDTYESGVLKETFLSDGHNLYTINHAEKTAFSRGQASRGTELRFDWNEEVSAKDKREGKARKLPNMIVAGKDCESFELITASGKTVLAGWNHVCLMIELTGPKMRKVSKAIKIEENASVPAEKFRVPRGYPIK